MLPRRSERPQPIPLRRRLNVSVLDGLNPPQLEAASTLSGPVLILAGAGSGKTRTLTHRLAYLIENGVPPYRIMAVTFTNKAAGEMKERVRALVGGGVADALWIGTFHSVCARILRRKAEDVGLDPKFSIYDSGDSLSLVKRICRARNIDEKVIRSQVIRAEISNAKNRLESPDEYSKEGGRNGTVVAQVYRSYQGQLAAANAVDFDDLLILPVRLFRGNPDALDEYRDRFEHLLIDEYQDTNRAQYVLVNMLAEKHRNICAVGDDDQSIYGWRGADIGNILNFEKDYPEAVVVRLEQNYRSTQRILEAAGAIVGNNSGRKGKELWTENDAGDPIVAAELEDEQDEAVWVHSTIEDACRNGHSYRDVAILYRTNAQSRAIEEVFVRNRTPYTVVGGLRFYERKEVKDVLAYLRVIDNPLDSGNLRRIINVPKRGIGETTVAKLVAEAERDGITLLDALRSSDSRVVGRRASKQVAELVDMLDGLIAAAGTVRADELVQRVVQESGYSKALHDEDSVEAEGRLENLNELLTAASRFAEVHPDDPSVSAFLQEVALMTDIDAWEDTVDVVTMMTLHSAKGLEFPIVFIGGMEDGLFPLEGAIREPSQLEEERRLFYVGLTRAREAVMLSSARRRRRFSERVPTIPSRFLAEIPDELLEVQVAPRSARKPAAPGRGRARGPLAEARRARIPETDREISGPQEAAAGDEEFSQEVSSNDEFSQVTDDFLEVGRFVIHSSFGRGKILGRDGDGDDLKLSIRFCDGRIKKLIARMANLEPCP